MNVPIEEDSDRTDDERSYDLSRRTFMKATGVAAGAGMFGISTVGDTAAATQATDPAFFNWRVREAMHAWDRGYRGRPDRTITFTDTGLEPRHPDEGPWNGVRAVIRNGEVLLPKSTRERKKVEGEGVQFSGTIGPGTFANPERTYHEFTTSSSAEQLDATMTWTPQSTQTAGEDIELLLEKRVDGSWEQVASSTNAGQPEHIVNYVEAGYRYRFVVYTYLNAYAEYTITGEYYDFVGEFTTYDESVVFSDVDSDNITPDTPKCIGWYDAGARYGTYDKPRDPQGHGTHVTSIMSGTGQGSAIDPNTVTEEDPHTVLTTGGTLSYEVEARSDTGVYGSAYGKGIEIVIRGPEGKKLDASTVGLDTSLHDNNIAETPTVHGDGTATYTVYIRSAEGELASTATVEKVSVGAFLREEESVGDRVAGSAGTIHAGIAPNESVVGLQGLSAPTFDLAEHADEFTRIFNLRAVNMSWGYVGGLPIGTLGGLISQLPAAIKDIAEGGVLTCAAAGNSATPANTGGPAVADESISVVATGDLDGISGYSSGGVAAIDEDDMDSYMKPDVTAPGGNLDELVDAAKNGEASVPKSEQPPIRNYTLKAGTSMATPYVNGIAGVVSQAMEEDAPVSIAQPVPTDTGLDDVLRLKQVMLATASETVFTAAPYHRGHAPTYDFGGRDFYEGFGRVNPGAAVDAVTRELSGTSEEVVGLNLPVDERVAAGYVQAGPGTVDVSVNFNYYSGGNAGATKGDPHLDLFVYDAENPREGGDPNIVARAAGVDGSASASVSVPRESEERTFYVVVKLVNVPGLVNGYDVQAHFDLSVEVTDGFFVSGSRSDDGDVFTGGQTNQVNLTVNPSEESVVRDIVPDEWKVLTDFSEDVNRVEEDPDTGVKYVYFDGTAVANTETSYTYFVEAPDGLMMSQSYTFGPVEVQPVGSDEWVSVSGTSDTNVVVGADSNA
jgi:hypothetical protein